MDDKIYIVFYSGWDDTEIQGIYKNREDASKAMNIMNGVYNNNYYTVGEFKVQNFAPNSEEEAEKLTLEYKLEY